MGWTGMAGKTADGVKEALKVYDYGKGKTAVVIASAKVAGAVWMVREYHQDGKPTGERFIMVTLINSRNGEVCWKEISEDMGPYHFNCPLHFLDIVPEPKRDPNSTFDWRACVRAWHEKNNRVIQAGDKYEAVGCGCKTITVRGIVERKRFNIVGETDEGKTYRFRKDMLGKKIG